MTDRHTAYIVTLGEPIRDDVAEDTTITALRQIKGVIDVRPVVDGSEQMAGAIHMEHLWRKAIYALLDRGPSGDDNLNF